MPKMEYVLANLEVPISNIFLARRPQPWWGLLRHYIEVKLPLSWPLHLLLLAAALKTNLNSALST